MKKTVTVKYIVTVNFLHAGTYLDSNRICLGKGGSYSKNILQLTLATKKKQGLAKPARSSLQSTQCFQRFLS